MKPQIIAQAVGIALGLSCISMSVLAAENTSESETALAEVEVNDRIVVTGSRISAGAVSSIKTPVQLVNVPQSLSFVSEQQIQEQGFNDIADILRYTPGASIGQGEGHRDQFTIRGQNTTADFFIDGLRDDVQYFRPLYNLEQVEILRGSNALLFGRGGGGGVINRVTKQPELAGSFNVLSANIDTFGAGVAAIDSNLAIDDNQALRINAFYESFDNHRDFNDGDRFAINPTYKYEFSSDTSVLLSYEYVDDDRLVDRGVPSLNGRPIDGFEDTYFGDPDFNRTTFEGHIAKARVDHKFSDTWSVNATMQYADYDKLYQNLYPAAEFDLANNQVTLDGYRDATQRENFITQINVVGEFDFAGLTHTMLIGAEYGSQDTDNTREDILFADSQDDQISFAFSDPLNIPEYSFPSFVRDRQSEVDFTSVFFQDEIRLSDNWLVVAGLRYDRFEIDVFDAIADAGSQTDDGLRSRTDNEVSPRGGLIYKPMENLSFYLSYSETFLPRSGDQFLTLSNASQELEPEAFENRELGVKWDITEALALTAAVFELERENGTTVDPNNPERSILTGTETEGFEIQLVGELTDNWSINAGYSHLEGEEVGRVADGEINNRTLSQVPENMASLWSRYDVSERLGFGLGIVYQDAQFANISNTVELPSFTRVDAAVFYQLDENTGIQLNVENLFDREYFPDAHNNNNISTGEPINATLAIRTRF